MASLTPLRRWKNMKKSMKPLQFSRFVHEFVKHEVLTYIEYRAVSGVFPTIFDPPPPLHPASASSPRTKGAGYTLAVRWGGGGSIFRKTPDIGLASYSIIPLRRKAYPIFFSPLSLSLSKWNCLAWVCSIVHIPTLQYSTLKWINSRHFRVRTCGSEIALLSHSHPTRLPNL